MKFTNLFIFLFIHSPTFAKLLVKQSLPSKSYATLETSEGEEIKIGDEVILSKNGRQCSAKVTTVSANLFNVSTSDCSFKEEILVGDIAEKPLLAMTVEAVKPEPPKSQAVAPNPTSIEDLSYLPNEGMSSFTGQLSTTYLKAVGKYPTGSTNGKITSTNFSYLFNHGLSNYLSITISGDLVTRATEYSYGTGPRIESLYGTFKSSGPEEPMFALAWRASGDSESSSKTHILLGAKPRLQISKYASKTSDGTAGIGGTQFKIAANFYKKANLVEFEFDLDRTIYTIQDSTSAVDSKRSTQSDMRNGTTITAGLQRRSSREDILIGGNLSYNYVEKYETRYYTDGNKTSADEMGSLSLTSGQLFMKFKIDESSVLKFNLDGIINGSQSQTEDTTKIDMTYESGATLGISWLQEY